jgi:hypothetical protein
MRMTPFLALLLSKEKPEDPDGEDHRAVKIKGLNNYVVKGVKEYSNAVVIIVKEKEVYKNDHR